MEVKYWKAERFYKKPWQDLLQEWYIDQKMSAPQIAEKLKDEAGVDMTCRNIVDWVRKLNINRSQAESMRTRVITGRMNYEQRKNFYEYRKHNTYAVYTEKGYLWATGLEPLIRKEGAIARMAKTLGCSNETVRSWIRFYYRVSPEYQGLICSYFGKEKNEIFSMYRPETPRKNTKRGECLGYIKIGWKYAVNLKRYLYEKEITLQEFSDRMNIIFPTVSEWVNCKHLVSPVDQQRVSAFLKIPICAIFSPYKKHKKTEPSFPINE